MKRVLFRLFGLFAFSCSALAQNYPAPQEGTWVVRDFKFHTGEVLPELKLHYRTIGDKSGEPVIIMHGTTGSGAGFLTPAFAGELFGPGQPLDAKRYYIILPDAVGHGRSSKPSDGLKMKFPRYNYDDMVDAQHRLVTEHLGVKHARLVMGNSMGGMETWIWVQKYPGFMDAAAPMAATPTEMASRNWMTRRLIIDSIRNDPDWKNGEYTTQPRSAQFASVFFGIATSGGDQALYKAGADARRRRTQLLDARLKAPYTAGRERRALHVGFIARLQPVRGPRAHRGHGARDQLGRRRAQPAAHRRDGPRDQAREERARVPDSGEREHRRPRHHRAGEVVEG